MQDVIVFAFIKSRPGCEDPLRRELLKLIVPTRAEPGCVSYDLHESDDHPGWFQFYEVWRSRQDFEIHLGSAHIAELRAAIPDFLLEPPQITTWKKI